MSFGDEWTLAQQALGELLYRVWRDSEPMRWPLYAYVEAELYRRHRWDAVEVLASFPVVGHVAIGSPYYCDVFYDRRGGPPQEDSPVGLTVSGMARVTDGTKADPAAVFVAMLVAAGRVRRELITDPFSVPDAFITSDQLAQALSVPASVTSSMWDLIPHEPYSVTGLYQRTHTNAGKWTATTGPRAARHPEGMIVEQYLNEVVATLTQPEVLQSRRVASPLALHEALHYLDITWQRHCPIPMLTLHNPAAIGALALDASNRDEVAARLGVLGDLLKGLQTHSASGHGGHALSKLKGYLVDTLADQADVLAATRQLGQLQQIVNLRNSLVHPQAGLKADSALTTLGFAYPPADWGILWLEIRTSVAELILALRGIIERLPVRGCAHAAS